MCAAVESGECVRMFILGFNCFWLPSPTSDTHLNLKSENHFNLVLVSWCIDAQAYIGSHIHIHCALIRPYITKYDSTCCTAADFNIAENYNAKDDGSDTGYDDVD